MPATELRAADTDRTAVAEVLGRGLHEGRLTVEEYDERLAAAYAARTHADLAVLTADLPSPTPAARRTARPGRGSCGGGDLRQEWRGYLATALLVTAIYLMSVLGTRDWLYPWPVWVVGPWGAVLLARTLTSRRGAGQR